jgi:bifunctional non-homologous end joining protein LigD
VYEEKVDGWRMLAYKDGRRVRLMSRRGVEHTSRFPDIAAAVARLPARTLILGGELCAPSTRRSRLGPVTLGDADGSRRQ